MQSICDLLKDNRMAAFNKNSQFITDVISFLLYCSPDHANHLINSATSHLQFLIANDMVNQLLRVQIEKVNLPDFYMSPSHLLFEDFLLNLISQLSQLKIKILTVKDLSTLDCKIFNSKNKKKIVILKIDNENYPVWKQEYIEHYKLCQDILLNLVDSQFDMKAKGITFDLVNQQAPLKKQSLHKKSLSVTMINNDNYFSLFSSIDNIKCISRSVYNLLSFLFFFCLKTWTCRYLQLFTLTQQRALFMDHDIDYSYPEDYDCLPNQFYSMPQFQRQYSQPINMNSQHFLDLQNDPNLIFASLSPQKVEQLKLFLSIKSKYQFFDEQKNYGFIIMDSDQSDIFVHYDDIFKAGVNKELLTRAKQGYIFKFQFSCMNYFGKYNKSRKAIDLKLLQTIQTQFPLSQLPELY